MLLVSGASGFLGSAVVHLARSRGIPVRCMVRASSSLKLLEGVPADSIVRADMADPKSLRAAVRGVSAVIHCAATTSMSAPDLELSRRINVQGTRALLDACREAGVQRFVNISSQSAHPANPSVYGRTKMEADQEVRAARDMDWTILRPSIIYGAAAKGIFDKMVQYCRKLPVVPIIGGGHEEMRPVHADDVAWAALACLDTPATIGKTYDIGGFDALEFNQFIKEILKALGKRKMCFHLPIPVALAMARALSLLMKNPPLTPDNVTGIQTVRHVDISAAQRDFGFAPRSFAQGLRGIFGAGPRGAASRLPGANDPTDPTDPTDVTEKKQAKACTTSGRPLRFAVIGLGKMGVMHASMCSVVPGVEVAALVDVDPKLGSQVQSMGVQAPFHASLDALFENERGLDGVIVSTPQFTHRAIGVACLERGLHVLSEKPLAHNLEDARLMAEAAERHPELVTAVGFMKGHYPLWIEAARRLQSGWIGTPRRFRATVYLSQVLSPRKGWTFTKEKSGGGILINSGIHLIHFLRVLFGDAVRVTALARPMHSLVEDTLAALIEYRGDVFGSYDASWSVPGYQTEGTTVLVEGDEGTLEITDDWLRTHHLTGAGGGGGGGGGGRGSGAPKGWSKTHRGELDRAAFTLSPDYGGEGYYNQIEDFARAIREKGKARYDWQEGLRVQEVIDALYRSAETRQTVEIA
jgi:predicted dehydrogenase/nucleoside-diphosphate-sugar epimerase